MVLAEVPLWVSHGSNNATDADATIRLPGLGGGGGGGTNKSNAAAAATSTTTNNNDNDNTQKSQQQQQLAHDAATAKAALSLLSSTKFSGGGSRRAPLYSIDVHPDGTRFATAAGDGSVKIWGVGSLFNGKLVLENNGNSNGTNKKKKKKRGEAPSRYTENGNYVSSNSEEYYEDDSSGSFSEGGNGANTTNENGGNQHQQSTKHQQSQQQQQNNNTPSSPQVGVNDLSGLVRKKKGGSVNVAAASASGANPFAAAASASTNTSNTNTASRDNQGPLSPLSRLTQQPPQPPGASSSTGEQQKINVNASNQSTSANNNIPPVKTHTQQQKQKQQKLLSTITSHEGSVLSLRFSPSGRYLATAGDDSYVNIYVRSNKPSLAKGNLVGVNADGESSSSPTTEDVEHWDRIAICRGHALDVVGLAWAPDDSHLVSCSLDSVHPVIVWRLFDVLLMDNTSQDTIGGAGGSSMMGGMGGGGFGGGGGLSSSLSSSVHIHTLHPFKVLGRDVHTSTVKGVAFDPAGKYLATSGDDPAICLWRAFDDWGLEARIDSSSGVFRSKKRKVHRSAGNSGDHGGGTNANNVMEEMEEDDPGELASLSLFRRISFAPDGSHVCGKFIPNM